MYTIAPRARKIFGTFSCVQNGTPREENLTIFGQKEQNPDANPDFQCLRNEFERKFHFEKKKSPNLPLNTKIFNIFEILKLV